MDTCAAKLDRKCAATSEGSQGMAWTIDREKWIQKYAVRILNRYLHWQTPLGVASTYAGRLKEDLVAFYDDPLKKMFIEASY